jgi:hypothetical protein
VIITPIAILHEKKTCPKAASHTLGFAIAEKSGVNSAFNPKVAPGSVTARTMIISMMTKSMGMRMKFAFSRPFIRFEHTRNALPQRRTSPATTAMFTEPSCMGPSESPR